MDVVDFKEAYTWRGGEPTPPGRACTGWIVEALPDALIEDPGLTDPQKAAILEPHRERITWDAPIHSVADVDALPFPPRTLNSKPSRFGSLRGLLEFYDTCAERGIALYGGGQFELGPGRGQIQYLASLFHPDAPNDVAPSEYNRARVGRGTARQPAAAEPGPDRLSMVAGVAEQAYALRACRCRRTSIRAWTRTTGSGSGAARRSSGGGAGDSPRRSSCSRSARGSALGATADQRQEHEPRRDAGVASRRSASTSRPCRGA